MASGLPHRPARGLSDTLSPVADDPAAQALWAANQEQLYASLKDLRAGVPRPALVERDRHGAPLRRAGAARPRLRGRLGRVERRASARPSRRSPRPRRGRLAHRRVDRSAAPIRARRRSSCPAAAGAGSRAKPVQRAGGQQAHRARRVARAGRRSRIDADGASTALAPAEEARAADSDEVIRSYEIGARPRRHRRDRHAEGTTSYPLSVIEDRPPTIAARAADGQPHRLLHARPSTSPTITA